MLVREILAIKGKVLFTVEPTTSLAGAISVMNEHNIGSLVAFEKGEMVGILTFREVLQAVEKNGVNWECATVGEAMILPPVIASPAMDLQELRRLMVDHLQRYIPVMDSGVLLGVVSFHDVAKAVLEEQNFENRMLKNYIRHWPEETEEKTQ